MVVHSCRIHPQIFGFRVRGRISLVAIVDRAGMTASTSSSQPLHLSDIGELLAAVPALLGFHPTRSFLVLSLSPTQRSAAEVVRGDAIGAVMRHDLLLPRADEPIPAPMSAAFERFCTVCVREGARAVLVVLVDDRLDHPHCPAAGAQCACSRNSPTNSHCPVSKSPASTPPPKLLVDECGSHLRGT